MKKITKLLYMLAALPLMMTSCVEEIVREPGDPDLEDCYGVYFKQLSKTDSQIELDPSAPTEIVLTALRPNSEDLADLPAITVPVEVQSPVTESGEKLFKLTEIKFEEGQIEAEFAVSFPEAELGVPYTCTIEITDKQYASLYSKNPNVVSFSVTRVKWNPVVGPDGETYGTYREGIISAMYGLDAVEAPIKIYERADKKGYYRIENMYGTELLCALLGATEDELESLNVMSPSMVYIDSTDPKKVIWEAGLIGVDLTAIADIKGPLTVGSFCDKYLNLKPSESLYGTNKDGVIKFPVNGLFMACGSTVYYGNMEGMVRIILPGCKDVDYTLAASAGLSHDGVTEVKVAKGLDVTSVKYAVVEGTLDNGGILSNAKKIAKGKLESKVIDFKDKAVASFGISMPETGVYTLVLAAFNGETLVNAAGSVFSYIAKGDECPVNVQCGLILSDKYAGMGATPENSVEAYIYGKDLTEVRMNLFLQSEFNADPSKAISKLKAKKPVKAEVLEEINTGVWSGLIDKLQKGTEYVLLVYATNDFEEKVVSASVKTEGISDPLQALYDVDMLAPAKEKKDYLGDWVLHYYNPASGSRIQAGIATLEDGGLVSDGENEYDVVNMKGLWTPLFTANGLELQKDVTGWDYYNGILFCNNPSEYGSISLGEGMNVYLLSGDLYNNGQAGLAYGAYLGAFTEFGDIAFIANPSPDFDDVNGVNSLAILAFMDPEYSQFAGQLLNIQDFLLADPSNVKDDAEAKSLAQCKTKQLLYDINTTVAKNYNYVETYASQVRKAIDQVMAEKEFSTGRLSTIETTVELPAADFNEVAVDNVKIDAHVNVTLK